MKYIYDVRVGKKYLKKDLKGVELKKYKIPFSTIKQNDKVEIYKKTISEKGTKIRLHKSFSVENIINDALNVDLYHYMDVDYDYSYNCIEENCDSICRCGKIIDLKINEVDESRIIEVIIGEISNNLNKRFLINNNNNNNNVILEYGIERILQFYHLNNKDNYYVDCHHSYYGEEIKSIKLDSLKEIEINISKLLFLTPINIIKYVLINEYGYLLKEINKLKKMFN